MVLQAQMAVLHNLAVLIVLSAVVRLALYACSTMPSVDGINRLKKQNNTHWSYK
jgi:hypothetical protein